MMGAIEGALRPPRAWEVLLQGLHSVMNGFGRLSFLVDENTAAMHFFVSALLTLCDRCTRPPHPPHLPSLSCSSLSSISEHFEAACAKVAQVDCGMSAFALIREGLFGCLHR